MTSPENVLVLWDIDGTLLKSTSAGHLVYAEVLRHLTGKQAVRRTSIDGKTDLMNLQEVFDAHGISSIPEDHVLEAALDRAFDAGFDTWREATAQLAGGAASMAALAGHGVRQSVLTGNTAHRTRVKLSSFSLDSHLDLAVGGVGSDGRHRHDLVGVAQRRAASAYGSIFGEKNTVLIGDTRRDVEAGQEGGALVLGVATGPDSTTTLLAAGADAVLPDLSDPELVLSTVRGLTGA